VPEAVKETLQVESINLTSKLVTMGTDNGLPAQVTEAALLNEGKQRETTNWFS